VEVLGQVQGVGFRPFVFRLARGLGLQGEVHNQSDGVAITVQGPAAKLEDFLVALRTRAPGVTREIHVSTGAFQSRSSFSIGPSQASPGVASALLTDHAICDDCRREFDDP
jgi:hydrogenase maturation protein HypF